MAGKYCTEGFRGERVDKRQGSEVLLEGLQRRMGRHDALQNHEVRAKDRGLKVVTYVEPLIHPWSNFTGRERGERSSRVRRWRSFRTPLWKSARANRVISPTGLGVVSRS